MGKANKKKNQKTLSVNTTQEESAQPLYWEYLMDYVGKITNSLMNNAAMVKQLSVEYSETLKTNSELDRLLKGFMLSLDDISKSTRLVMNRHVTFNGDVQVDHKKGLVNGGTDDALEFLAITNEYNSILDRINALSTNGYLNIFMKLKAYDVEKVASFNNINTGDNNGKQQ